MNFEFQMNNRIINLHGSQVKTINMYQERKLSENLERKLRRGRSLFNIKLHRPFVEKF